MATPSTFGRALGAVALVGLLATGCSSAPAATADVPNHSIAPAVSADDTCGELSELAQVAFDADRARAAGELTQEEFTAALKDQVTGYAQVSVEPGTELAQKLDDYNAYADTAVPAPDGSPYDRGSVEYVNVAHPLVEACIAAGSDIVVRSPGG